MRSRNSSTSQSCRSPYRVSIAIVFLINLPASNPVDIPDTSRTSLAVRFSLIKADKTKLTEQVIDKVLFPKVSPLGFERNMEQYFT